MFSEGLQSLLVVLALIGAALLLKVTAGAKAGARRSSVPQAPRVLAASEAANLVPVPPPPVRVVVETPSVPNMPSERRRRRLTLVEARKGIVLAAILGPCRAHWDEQQY